MSCKRLIVNQKMRLLYSYTIVISEESQPLHMQDIFFEKFLLRVVSNDYLCFPFLIMSIINVLDKPLVDNHMGVLFLCKHFSVFNLESPAQFHSNLKDYRTFHASIGKRGMLDFISWHIFLDYKGPTRLYMGLQSYPKTQK